jgi:hypothetical protein
VQDQEDVMHPDVHNMESARPGSKLAVACCHFAHNGAQLLTECTLVNDTPKIILAKMPTIFSVR